MSKQPFYLCFLLHNYIITDFFNHLSTTFVFLEHIAEFFHVPLDKITFLPAFCIL